MHFLFQLLEPPVHEMILISLQHSSSLLLRLFVYVIDAAVIEALHDVPVIRPV